MKVSVPRKALSSALKVVSAPTKGVAGSPVLRGVRIDATDDGTVTLTCTNYDLTVSMRIDTDRVITPGVAIPPAGLLGRLVDSFAGDAVELALGDDTLSVAGGRSVGDLHVFPIEEWPRIQPVDGDSVELDADALDLIARILPMVLVDETRKVLAGVRFDGRWAFATDSYRGAVADLNVDVPSVTLPAASLAPILKSRPDRMRLAAAGGQATLHGDDLTVTMRTIEGEYPAVERLWRDTSSHQVTVATEPLADALRRLGAFDSTPIIDVETDSGRLQLVSKQADVGSVTDEIDVTGDMPDRMRFNGGYLRELLEAAAADEVTLEVVDPMKPVMVRTDRLRQILMPIRISGPGE